MHSESKSVLATCKFQTTLNESGPAAISIESLSQLSQKLVQCSSQTSLTSLIGKSSYNLVEENRFTFPRVFLVEILSSELSIFLSK